MGRRRRTRTTGAVAPSQPEGATEGTKEGAARSLEAQAVRLYDITGQELHDASVTAHDLQREGVLVLLYDAEVQQEVAQERPEPARHAAPTPPGLTGEKGTHPSQMRTPQDTTPPA